jgi:hypothetical protein
MPRRISEIIAIYLIWREQSTKTQQRKQIKKVYLTKQVAKMDRKYSICGDFLGCVVFL